MITINLIKWLQGDNDKSEVNTESGIITSK